jgi:mono/diheme cytochrome c family protein
MHDQPKYDPLEASDFFADQRSQRPPVEGTVARGRLNEDTAYFSGKGASGQLVAEFPFAVTREVVSRGQERYNVFCAPCHDRLGAGLGMIVRRGYRRPPSYHIDRLRTISNGHMYDVITNGFGAMPDYASQIPPADRWAIVAYVRALQRSQSATAADVPPEAMATLKQEGARP